MANQNKYLKVNWANGMKINKEHFIALQNSLLQEIQVVSKAGINTSNYGLLPANSEDGLNLQITQDNQGQAKVQVTNCTALLPDGCIININKEFEDLKCNYPNVAFDENNDAGNYYLILSANPYDVVAVGDASKDEDPPRQPFTMSKVALHFISEDELAASGMGSNHMPIAKYSSKGDGKLKLDADYIPPSTCMASHPDLVELYTNFTHQAGSLEEVLVYTVQKINQRDQLNDLSAIAIDLVKQILPELARSNTSLAMNSLNNSPLCVTQEFATLARITKNALDTKAGSGKDEFLNYVSEMCNVRIDDIHSALENIINHTYNHNNIQTGLEKATVFIELLHDIFRKLSNLEYIGKRGDGALFVKEYKVQEKSKADDPGVKKEKQEPAGGFMAD